MQQVGLGQHLFRSAVAVDLGEGGVGEQRPVVAVDDDPLQRAFDQGRQAALAVAQLGLLGAQVGDVDRRAQNARHPAGGAEQRRQRHQPDPALAVDHQLLVVLDHLAGLHTGAVAAVETGGEVRVGQVVGAASARLFVRQAGALLVAPIEGGVAELAGGQHVDDKGRRPDRIEEALQLRGVEGEQHDGRPARSAEVRKGPPILFKGINQ